MTLKMFVKGELFLMKNASKYIAILRDLTKVKKDKNKGNLPVASNSIIGWW